jgi:hypothetical protein
MVFDTILDSCLKMELLHNTFNLPQIEDFKTGGRFHNLKNFSSKKPLPNEILQFIYPKEYIDSLFNQKTRQKISSKVLLKLRNYCLALKKTAMKEEKDLFIKQKKELEKRQMEEYFTKQLEDKIKEYYSNYYKTLYQTCTCKMNKEK